ncbi:hypothetical protein BGZ92_003377, partial [Podila epicladia]
MNSIILSTKTTEYLNYLVRSARCSGALVVDDSKYLLYNKSSHSFRCEGLNCLLPLANKRELFVELCLIPPIHLSVLLHYLNFLMSSLILALQISSK